MEQDAIRTKRALEHLGLSPAQLSDEDLADPRIRANIARIGDTLRSKPFDWLKEFWLNSILSGPRTQSANIVGNTTFGLWETLAQRLIEVTTNLAVRDPDAAQIGEFRSMYRGLLPALARSGGTS